MSAPVADHEGLLPWPSWRTFPVEMSSVATRWSSSYPVTVFVDGTFTVWTYAIVDESGRHAALTTLSICGGVARTVQFRGSGVPSSTNGRPSTCEASEPTLDAAA